MKRTLAGIVALAAVAVLSQACFAVEKKAAKVNEEEALREEIKTMMNQAVQTRHDPVSGKFMLAKDEVANEKPLPKLIGYVNQQGSLVPVMVMNQSMLSILAQQDQKDVKLFGKYLDKGEKGKYLIVDDISLSAGGGSPQMKRKRGGL